ncbi:hypothetical protein EPUL_005658, partial [Erysiphe pulchra]
MDSNEFRKAAISAIDKITNYYDTIEDRRLISNVEPGYLRKLLPDGPPQVGEPWADIQKDIEAKIMPGITHWQSPNFMAFFPASSSYPGILGEIYSAAFNAPAFNWACSPAMTELETIVLDWLAKLINLPECYQSSSTGGGVIHGSASEAILTVMMVAREKYLNQVTSHLTGISKEEAMHYKKSKMVVLASDSTHSSTQKAAKILGLRFISIPVYPEDSYALVGANLEKILLECKLLELEPFFLTVTLGTTGTCAIDDFSSILSTIEHFKPLGQPGEMWVHVDAAYAGAALVCPEFHHHTATFKHFQSIDLNAHKWLLTNFDATCLFVKERKHLIESLSINPSYLVSKASENGQVIDYRDWQIPLGRRFRSLKIWFVLRTYGVTGLQAYIRNHIRLGEIFASLCRERCDLFKIVAGPSFALTVFTVVSKISQDNELTKAVYQTVHQRGQLHLTPCVLGDVQMIRLVCANRLVEESHVRGAFKLLVEVAEELRDLESRSQQRP